MQKNIFLILFLFSSLWAGNSKSDIVKTGDAFGDTICTGSVQCSIPQTNSTGVLYITDNQNNIQFRLNFPTTAGASNILPAGTPVRILLQNEEQVLLKTVSETNGQSMMGVAFMWDAQLECSPEILELFTHSPLKAMQTVVDGIKVTMNFDKKKKPEKFMSISTFFMYHPLWATQQQAPKVIKDLPKEELKQKI